MEVQASGEGLGWAPRAQSAFTVAPLHSAAVQGPASAQLAHPPSPSSNAQATLSPAPGPAGPFLVEATIEGERYRVAGLEEQQALATQAVLWAKAAQQRGEPGWAAGLDLEPDWLEFIEGASWGALLEELGAERVPGGGPSGSAEAAAGGGSGVDPSAAGSEGSDAADRAQGVAPGRARRFRGLYRIGSRWGAWLYLGAGSSGGRPQGAGTQRQITLVPCSTPAEAAVARDLGVEWLHGFTGTRCAQNAPSSRQVLSPDTALCTTAFFIPLSKKWLLDRRVAVRLLCRPPHCQSITLHYKNLTSTEPTGLMGRMGSASLVGLGTEYFDRKEQNRRLLKCFSRCQCQR